MCCVADDSQGEKKEYDRIAGRPRHKGNRTRKMFSQNWRWPTDDLTDPQHCGVIDSSLVPGSRPLSQRGRPAEKDQRIRFSLHETFLQANRIVRRGRLPMLVRTFHFHPRTSVATPFPTWSRIHQQCCLLRFPCPSFVQSLS